MKLFKFIKNFGLIYTTKIVFHKLLKKITKRDVFQKKYFNDVLRFLDHNYSHVMTNEIGNNTIEKDYKVWIFWWQGLNDSTPAVVKKCVNSIVKNFKNHDVVIITKENFQGYVKIPDYILKKVEDGVITITHFSDIIRANLLSDYGGVWLDATCYLTDSIEDELAGKCFYSNKIQYENWLSCFVEKAQWSAFFLAGAKGNPIFVNIRNILHEYWKKT